MLKSRHIRLTLAFLFASTFIAFAQPCNSIGLSGQASGNIVTYSFQGQLEDAFGALPVGTPYTGHLIYDAGQANQQNGQAAYRGDYTYQEISLTIGGTTISDMGPGVINLYDHGTFDSNLGGTYPTDLLHVYMYNMMGSVGGLSLATGAGFQFVLQDVAGAAWNGIGLPNSSLTMANLTGCGATFIELRSQSGDFARGNLTECPTILSCPPDQYLAVGASNCSAVANYPVPSISGACYGNGPGILSVGLPSGSAFPLGITTVTYEFNSNVSSQCSFNVIVEDHIAPSIACPSDLTVACGGGGIVLGSPQVSDNCGLASVFNVPPATYLPGNNIVTWTAIDNSGNTSTCMQQVTIGAGPIVDAGADDFLLVKLNCGGQSAKPMTTLNSTVSGGLGPYAYDWSPVVGLSSTIIPNPISSGITGPETYTLTITDSQGCTATDQVTVSVIDQCNPTNCANNSCNQVFVCYQGGCYTANVNANCSSSNSLCWYLNNGGTLGGTCGGGCKQAISTSSLIQGSGLAVFPNPTHQDARLRLECESCEARPTGTLSNLLGVKLRRFELQKSSNGAFVAELEMDDLAVGVYQVIIRSGDQFWMKKVVKE